MTEIILPSEKIVTVPNGYCVIESGNSEPGDICYSEYMLADWMPIPDNYIGDPVADWAAVARLSE